jgi:hypothetical protein
MSIHLDIYYIILAYNTQSINRLLSSDVKSIYGKLYPCINVMREIEDHRIKSSNSTDFMKFIKYQCKIRLNSLICDQICKEKRIKFITPFIKYKAIDRGDSAYALLLKIDRDLYTIYIGVGSDCMYGDFVDYIKIYKGDSLIFVGNCTEGNNFAKANMIIESVVKYLKIFGMGEYKKRWCRYNEDYNLQFNGKNVHERFFEFSHLNNPKKTNLKSYHDMAECNFETYYSCDYVKIDHYYDLSLQHQQQRHMCETDDDDSYTESDDYEIDTFGYNMTVCDKFSRLIKQVGNPWDILKHYL